MRALITSSLLCLAFTVSGCKKDEPAAKPVAAAPVEAAKAQPVAAPASGRVIELAVTDDGFEPDDVKLKANEPVTFRVTRKTDDTCARDLLIDGTDIKLPLPLNETVEVAWTPTKAGAVKFGCAMDMMVGGTLLVE